MHRTPTSNYSEPSSALSATSSSSLNASKHKQYSTKLHIDTLEPMILLSASCHASEISQVDSSVDISHDAQNSDSASSNNSCSTPTFASCHSKLPSVIENNNGCGGSGAHATSNFNHQVKNSLICNPAPACNNEVSAVKCDDSRPPVTDDFDSILEWNDVMLKSNAADHSRTAPEQGGPILTARAFAIVSAAMYDAYNSIEHIGEAYLVDAPYTNGANSDAAVAEAAYQTLRELYPSQKATFDAELADSLARIADGASEDLGRAVGLRVAEKILEARADDGYAKQSDEQYVPNGLPGFHDVDPLNPNQGFYGADAFKIDPFAVESADQFQSDPIDDGTAEGRIEFMNSEKYLKAFEEVKSLGGDGITTPTTRTAEQTEIGMFWGYDGRPEIGTPPRLYNQIVREIATDKGNTEAENARLFALVNISMADAGVTAWNTKYDDAFWRPILGIREGDLDGNPDTVGDANFTPVGAQASNPRAGEANFTPNFPAYTSGHATFGAAAFQSVARFYGTDDIAFSFVSDEFNGKTIGSDGSVRPVVERSFSNLTQAKIENADSRIYLGIHWAFDATDGIEMGDSVADYVFDHALGSKKPTTTNNGSSQLA